MTWVTREIPPGSGRWRAVNEPARPHPGAAPPFDCADCGRRIGKGRSHWLLRASRRVVCSGCYLERHHSGEAECSGTRAGIAARLGLWPRKATP